MTKYLDLINNISFANPEAFFLYIIIMLHIIWYILKGKQKQTSINFSSTDNFSSKKSWKQKFLYLPYICKLITACFLILALARPQTETSSESINTKGIHIAMVMDISGSMLAGDMVADDPFISRCDVARGIAIDFIKKRKGDNISLVFYNHKVSIPIITTDHQALISQIKSRMRMKQDGGTAIGDALNQAILPLSDVNSKSKVIILLTDGKNTHGIASPLDAALNARNLSKSIKIHTIGIGSKNELVPVPRIKRYQNGKYNLDKDGGIQYEPGIDYQKLETDSKLLKQIADTTGGKYFHATNKLELSTIYDEIDKLEKIDISEERFTIKHEQFYPLVFISIIIYILGIITQLTILRKIP